MAYGGLIRNCVRYGYAVGRVRVLETRLLKRSHFERLLDARSYEEQRRVLSETVYGSYLDQTRTAEDVEGALDRALAELYRDFLEKANLPVEMVVFFRRMHDFENLRGRLKAEVLGIAAAELLNDLGSVSADRFASGDLPTELIAAELAIRTRAGGEGGLSVDTLDLAVDNERFAALETISSRAQNPHLRGLAVLGADLASTRAFVRARGLGRPLSEIGRHAVPGGTITAEQLTALGKIPLEDAMRRLVARPTLSGADPEALADPARFDVAADALILRHLHRARMVAIGPEPVVAYVMQRKVEVAMLRTLLIGRLAGVGRDVLRARMRDVA